MRAAPRSSTEPKRASTRSSDSAMVATLAKVLARQTEHRPRPTRGNSSRPTPHTRFRTQWRASTVGHSFPSTTPAWTAPPQASTSRGIAHAGETLERSGHTMGITAVEVAGDECDQCPHDAHVAAYVYAEFKTGSVALCGHHGTLGWDNLQAQATKVIDLRRLIPGWTPPSSIGSSRP